MIRQMDIGLIYVQKHQKIHQAIYQNRTKDHSRTYQIFLDSFGIPAEFDSVYNSF